MNKGQNTPEPCLIEHQTLERALIVLDPKHLLYEITQGGECIARTHTKEWANMIAAAPDHDSAARLVIKSAIPNMAGSVLISVEAFRATNAAIAKAEGLIHE